MNYSTRIIEIGKYISKRKIADIGCDHGYLLTYLFENDLIDFGIGADVNEGPLLNAKKNISKKNLNEKTELYLSNGLDKLDANDYDSIVVAGMGGSLIASILSNDFDKVTGKEVIVQPNNNSKALRTLMQKNDFKVSEEKLIKDNDVIYEILKFVPGQSDWNELELEFGKFNLEENTDIFKELYTQQANVLEKHLSKVQNEFEKEKLNKKIMKLRQVIDYKA